MSGIWIKCLPRSGEWGKVLAEDGDCLSLTFSKSGCHTPILKKISKTVTTMCDHDIGVVIDEK